MRTELAKPLVAMASVPAQGTRLAKPVS